MPSLLNPIESGPSQPSDDLVQTAGQIAASGRALLSTLAPDRALNVTPILNEIIALGENLNVGAPRDRVSALRFAGLILIKVQAVVNLLAEADSQLQFSTGELEESTWRLLAYAIRGLSSPAAAAPAPPNETPGHKGHLLIVDDELGNRRLLKRRVEREGYTSEEASDGIEALEILKTSSFDLVLLDVMMPGLDGYSALQRMKSDPALKEIPVVMVSAVDEAESVARCIEIGADDYLPKPFDPVILRARIRASVERKQRADQLKRMFEEIRIERERAETLLLNVLPKPIAEELRTKNCVAPMYFEDVTILFTDFVGFTISTERLAAEDLVAKLDHYFTAFDRIIERHGLEKLKTIGDSYMCAAGLPERRSSHPVDATMAALEIIEFTRNSPSAKAGFWPVRVGLHTGSVIAGVVGIRKFAFDIWGESVNLASRMESGGSANRLNISAATYTRIKDFFDCEHRGRQLTKDCRELDMYFVNQVRPHLKANGGAEFEKRYQIYFRSRPNVLPACVFHTSEDFTGTEATS